MGLVEDADTMLGRPKADAIIVGFSGGKDSIAVLDLCVKRFARVEAFFMFLVADLRCEERMLTRVLQRFPTVTLHRLPSPQLAENQRKNILGCNPRERKVAKLDLGKIEAHLRAKTGIDWFAYAERSADGFARRAKLNPIKGYWEKFRRIYPIWDWKERNVIAYLRQVGLPCPTEKIGGRKVSGAVSLHPKVLSWLKAAYPDDYAKIVRVFPLAPAAVFRWEAGLAPDRKGTFHDGSKACRSPGADDQGEGPEEGAQV